MLLPKQVVSQIPASALLRTQAPWSTVVSMLLRRAGKLLATLFCSFRPVTHDLLCNCAGEQHKQPQRNFQLEKAMNNRKHDEFVELVYSDVEDFDPHFSFDGMSSIDRMNAESGLDDEEWGDFPVYEPMRRTKPRKSEWR